MRNARVGDVARRRYGAKPQAGTVISIQHRIENRIIRNLGQLGYGGAPWIGPAKICRGGFVTVDLMILLKGRSGWSLSKQSRRTPARQRAG